MREQINIRKRLSKNEAVYLGIEPKPNERNRKQARYFITKEQAEEIDRLRSKPNKRKFVTTQKSKNKDGVIQSTIEKLQSKPIKVPDNFEVIKISTSKTTGQQWVQYAPKAVQLTPETVDFENLIKKYIKPIKVNVKPLNEVSGKFDRLVFSDVHIGMDTNSNGFSLYGGKWDETELFNRLETMIKHVINNQTSDRIFIDELGDFMDGWDGETVRKGHKLPQNMDNEKAFDLGLKFKITLMDALAENYSDVIFNNICNDNHAGSFAYVVNSAFKQIAEIRYNHVTVNNIRDFIDHYTVGNKCFILSHGKDGKNLKFGFKPFLDAKQIEKIDNYIKEHNLHNYEIEFSKGDSHQKVFDESSSDSFNYFNYPAFSPSSEWVQTNFKKGMSGFEFFNYSDSVSMHPYKFKWVKGKEKKSRSY
jgi:hypothetical protein